MDDVIGDDCVEQHNCPIWSGFGYITFSVDDVLQYCVKHTGTRISCVSSLDKHAMAKMEWCYHTCISSWR